jgi:glycosyltransferase involved in cell wall biosynthesis
VIPTDSRRGERARAVLGLFSELDAPGGIQRSSRHIGAVLSSWAEECGGSYRFLSLNDSAGMGRIEVGGRQFEYEGFERSKSRYSRAALAAGPHTLLIFATHPNLAPAGWLVKKRTGARLAVVAWGIDVWKPLPLHRRWPLRRADAVLAISRYTAEQVKDVLGVSAARVHLLPLALDPAFWERAQNAGEVRLPAGFPQGRTLLTVTRLAANEGYKGVDTVIRALPELARVIPDVHYVVVGDGDDRPRLEALARTLGVADRVHFLGRLEAESPGLIGCYSSCDAFVMPSRGEGFGLVFLEAMAFGKPVVGGAHGGTADVIEDGVTGFLVEHGDTARLTQILAMLLRDQNLRQQMGERARARVQEKFLFAHFAARLRECVEALCAGKQDS